MLVVDSCQLLAVKHGIMNIIQTIKGWDRGKNHTIGHLISI
jgi:hypothetical protein